MTYVQFSLTRDEQRRLDRCCDGRSRSSFSKRALLREIERIERAAEDLLSPEERTK